MSRWFLLVPPALMLLSCCLPALEFDGDKGVDIMFGARALALGWLGLLAGLPGWLANPVWLAGLALGLFRRNTGAAIAGGLALLAGCTVFAMVGRQLPADEGGVTHMHVVRLLPGFYVWLLSFASLTAVCLPRIGK